jgi:hypothetical protein
MEVAGRVSCAARFCMVPVAKVEGAFETPGTLCSLLSVPRYHSTFLCFVICYYRL